MSSLRYTEPGELPDARQIGRWLDALTITPPDPDEEPDPRCPEEITDRQSMIETIVTWMPKALEAAHKQTELAWPELGPREAVLTVNFHGQHLSVVPKIEFARDNVDNDGYAFVHVSRASEDQWVISDYSDRLLRRWLREYVRSRQIVDTPDGLKVMKTAEFRALIQKDLEPK